MINNDGNKEGDVASAHSSLKPTQECRKTTSLLHTFRLSLAKWVTEITDCPGFPLKASVRKERANENLPTGEAFSATSCRDSNDLDGAHLMSHLMPTLIYPDMLLGLQSMNS